MARDPYPSETSDRFIVRFPDGMRDRLKAIAAENGRSLNAEIVYRLQETLMMDDYVSSKNAAPAEPDDGLNALARLSLQVENLSKKIDKIAGDDE